MEAYKVSVIVPVYNAEKYIRRCVGTLTGQTYKNLEILLVDDGSRDDSGGICDDLAKEDERIRVIHKENGGLVSARTAGAMQASGDYVCSVDGDDWIEPDRMRNFAERGARTGADMVYMEGYYKEYEGRSSFIQSDIPEGLYEGAEVMEKLFPLLIRTDCCFRRPLRGTLWCWGFKRELFQRMRAKMDDRISMGEDHAHLILCMPKAKTVFLMKEAGYHYVMREDSITHTLNRASLEGLKIWFRIAKEQMAAHGCSRELYLHMVFLEIWYIMNCDYSILLERPREFLYPYPQVKKGSRVAVYGAGTVGVQIIRMLAQSEEYELPCWADSYSGGRMLEGHMVQGMQGLLEAEFDYVAIAVLDRDIVDEIRKSLLECGIPEEKIAAMDAGAISGEDLPEGF